MKNEILLEVRKKSFYTGIISGLIAVLIMFIPSGFIGYSNYNEEIYVLPLEILFIKIFVVYAILGGLMGYLPTVLAISKEGKSRKKIHPGIVFCIGFITTLVLIQLKARDALVPVDFYVDPNNPLIKWGGPLGQPNFESIANGMVGGILMLALYQIIIEHKMSDRQLILYRAFKTAILTTVVYGLIYIVFLLILRFNILTLGSEPFGTGAVFKTQFPHPERFYIVFLISICFVLVNSMGYYLSIEKLVANSSIIPNFSLFTKKTKPIYDVAISFAGSERDLAITIGFYCQRNGISIFYDDLEQLWGKDLKKELKSVFGKQAKYVLVIVSKEYVKRYWTMYEFRSALTNMVDNEWGRILPIKIDDAILQELPDSIAYIPIDISLNKGIIGFYITKKIQDLLKS